VAVNERILIEIQTVAQMAGIDQVTKGMLGMSPPLLAAAAALGILIAVGKSAIDNAQAQQAAYSNVSQAVDSYNATLGKAIPLTAAQSKAIETTADAQGKAQDSLVISQNTLSLAQLAYTDAVKKHGVESEQARKAYLALGDAQIREKQAQDALTDATNAANVAGAVNATTVQGQTIFVGDLDTVLQNFIQTNKAYIDNQYDVISAAGDFVRAGNGQADTLMLLNDALDLSIAAGMSYSDSVNEIILAEAGRGKGLAKLGISQQDYKNAVAGTTTEQQKAIAIHDLLNPKIDKARQETSDLQQAQHTLNTDWQDFSTRLAPLVVGGLTDITKAADTALQMLNLLITAINYVSASKIGGSGTAPSQQAPGGGYTFQGGGGLGYIPKAGGGPVSPGGVYVVGEKGPETLVMGSQGGTIVPNGGGNTVILNIYGTVQTERNLLIAMQQGLRQLDREQR
jgi:hypothetical protein